MKKQTLCKIVETEIILDELMKSLSDESTGAVVIFTGLVRGFTDRGDPHETIHLDYEAYIPMAEKMMQRIADEIRTRWDSIGSIVIVQRIGRLVPGTPAVAIACSAAHRDTGVFDAARYGIDRLKEVVPVWKKETTLNGEEWSGGG